MLMLSMSGIDQQVKPKLPYKSSAQPFSSCSVEVVLLLAWGALLPRLCPRPVLQPCLSGRPICVVSFSQVQHNSPHLALKQLVKFQTISL